MVESERSRDGIHVVRRIGDGGRRRGTTSAALSDHSDCAPPVLRIWSGDLGLMECSIGMDLICNIWIEFFQRWVFTALRSADAAVGRRRPSNPEHTCKH